MIQDHDSQWPPVCRHTVSRLTVSNKPSSCIYVGNRAHHYELWLVYSLSHFSVWCLYNNSVLQTIYILNKKILQKIYRTVSNQDTLMMSHVRFITNWLIYYTLQSDKKNIDRKSNFLLKQIYTTLQFDRKISTGSELTRTGNGRPGPYGQVLQRVRRAGPVPPGWG